MPALAVMAFGQTNSDVVIRSSVREVLLDVVVRDAHGRLINNLKPEQFSVKEDGAVRPVRSFRLVSGSEVRAEDQRQAAEERTAAAPNQWPRFNPLRTVNVVCLILQDLDQNTRAFAFQAAQKFVENELRPNTFIGVFALDAGGLRAVYPFSNDRDHLLKAVKLASINQLPELAGGSAALLQGLSLATMGAPSANTDVTSDGASSTDPLGTRGDMAFTTIASLREIDALKTLVRQLSAMPFQKTVLLMGTGLTRPADQLEYWNSLIEGANKGDVTFYALDVHGLGNSSPLAPANAMLNRAAALSRNQQAAKAPAGQTMEMMHQTDYLRYGVLSANKQEAMHELAERTGGFLIANTNNTDLLGRVMEEVDTHYEISYEPAAESEDGHFRKIAVVVDRPEVQVQTRSGYYAVPDTGDGPMTPAEIPGLKALDGRPLPHAFNFRAQAYRFRAGDGAEQCAIAFEVPIANLTATAEAGNRHKVHTLLLALVKDERGQVVHRVSRDVPSEVSDQAWPAVRGDAMTWEHAVNLPAGRYTIDAAVVDEEGNRASTTAVQVENEARGGIGLSDIALVRRVEELKRTPDAADPFEFTGKRVLPLVSNALPAGARASVYFVVYPQAGAAAKPQVTVTLLEDGKAISAKTIAPGEADSSGGIPVMLSFGGNAGDYEVRVTAAQGGSSVERSIQYSIAGG
jgi:VWFA-related protein